jgi:hypothetical protein
MKKPKLNQKLQEAVLGGRGLIQRLCEDDHEVFIALAHYSDETGRCHIKSHESLTSLTYGLSKSSVAASLESLRRAGFIGKEQEWVYTIHYRLDQHDPERVWLAPRAEDHKLEKMESINMTQEADGQFGKPRIYYDEHTGLFTENPGADRSERHAAYEEAQQAKLDRIRKLDVDYRERLKHLPDRDDEPEGLYFEEKRIRSDEVVEVGFARRLLVTAAETFLQGLVEMTATTGEQLVEKATTTEELIALLQAQQDERNRTFGAPWER